MTKQTLQNHLDQIDLQYRKIALRDITGRRKMLDRMERMEFALELMDSGQADCAIQALLMVE